ncbi:MAG TPA: carboxypeptidase regulatory-like domain-containing protein [Micromonosporaceae bacterium]
MITATVGLAGPAYAEGTGSLSGRLLDAAGNPVAGTAVTAISTTDWSTVGYAQTAADGTYSIPSVSAGTVYVSFQPPAAPEQWAYGKKQQWSADQITVTVGTDTVVDDTLLPSGMLSGTVTTPTGSPASNVDVIAINQDDYSQTSASTDWYGNYRLPVFAGKYKVEFQVGYGQVEYAPRQVASSKATVFTVSDGSQTTVNEQLLGTGTVSGSFSGQDGTPVAGEQVALYVDAYDSDGVDVGEQISGVYGSTDSTGHFSMSSVRAGTYKVKFTAPDWSRSQFAYGKTTVAAADSITVDAGGTAQVDERALGDGTVTVTATSSLNGAAIANFCAEIDPAWRNTCSNGSGKVVLTGVQEGDHVVQVTTNDGLYEPVGNIKVSVVAGQNTDLPVRLTATAAIDVSVVDRASGAPVSGTCLAPLVPGRSVMYGARYCTDEQGKVRIGSMPAGTFTLYAIPSDGSHGSQWVGTDGGTGDQKKAAQLTTTIGTVTTAPTVLLDPAGTVTGRVTTASGEPVRYGTVSTLSWDPGFGPEGQIASVGSDGTYRLTGLGPYKWPLLFQAEGMAAVWSGGYGNRYDADLVKVPAGGTATADATLDAGVAVSGTVTTIAGSPVGTCRLRAYNKVSGDIMGYADTDASGHYTMTLAGDQTVKVWYNGNLNGTIDGWYLNATNQADATPVEVPRTGTLTLNVSVQAP